MKQMFGRWHLQVKLAKLTCYVEKRFSASQSKVLVEPDKYPPSNEGMVQMVLAPTMEKIRSILPEQVDILLTKAWIHKLAKDVVGQPNAQISLNYLEYLIKLQRDYEDMEKRYNLVHKQEFLNMPYSLDTQYYQLASLQEQVVELMKYWLVYNMNAQSKCELPIHPSQIQIVYAIEGYRVAKADKQNNLAIRKLLKSPMKRMKINPLKRRQNLKSSFHPYLWLVVVVCLLTYLG